jgi:hypothetical protein
VKDNGFPWTGVGQGLEPALPNDFASRVIERARELRSRKRRAKIGLGAAGLAAIVTISLWMRGITNNQVAAHGSHRTPNTSTDYGSNDANSELLAVMMPDAVQTQRFDAYYGTGWDAYASADPAMYEFYRLSHFE